jgi:hypothetical protein
MRYDFFRNGDMHWTHDGRRLRMRFNSRGISFCFEISDIPLGSTFCSLGATKKKQRLLRPFNNRPLARRQNADSEKLQQQIPHLYGRRSVKREGASSDVLSTFATHSSMTRCILSSLKMCLKPILSVIRRSIVSNQIRALQQHLACKGTAVFEAFNSGLYDCWSRLF